MKPPSASTEHPGIAALRSILKRMRWDDQGGYVGYEGNGKWSFVTASLPQATPEEINALFALVGVEPDVIVPLGLCKDCVHSTDGRERGYAGDCYTCAHPRQTNFVPLKRKA